LLLVAGLAALAAGCATSPGDPRDPWEGMNRGIYRVNEKLDDWVVRPAARGYQKWVPGEIRSRVRNFFGNIADPFIGVNNMLQGKF
jgi:phospholipid-binding lipoprotein MlaA